MSLVCMIQTRLDSFVLCNPCPTIPETLPKPKYVHPKCPHGKRGQHCRDCGGSSICEHKKRRYDCRDCGGLSICKHGNKRYICVKCGGVGICEHKKRRQHCRDCGGSSICEHKKLRVQCKECDPISYNIHLRRNRRREALKGVINPTHTLDDLCMTHGEWDMYLHKLFEVRYGRLKTEDDEVQIDEIIPCSAWNLPDDNKYCWHYLNSQWLIDNTNQEKGTKYTEEDKRAMIQRIDEWFIVNPYPPYSTSSP